MPRRRVGTRKGLPLSAAGGGFRNNVGDRTDADCMVARVLQYCLKRGHGFPDIRDDRVNYLDLTNNKLAIPQDSDTLTTPPLAVPSLMTAHPHETRIQASWPKPCWRAK